MNEPLEFICEDCKISVTRYGRFEPKGTEPKYCLVCYWIREIPDLTEEQKQQIRDLNNDQTGTA